MALVGLMEAFWMASLCLLVAQVNFFLKWRLVSCWEVHAARGSSSLHVTLQSQSRIVLMATCGWSLATRQFFQRKVASSSRDLNLGLWAGLPARYPLDQLPYSTHHSAIVNIYNVPSSGQCSVIRSHKARQRTYFLAELRSGRAAAGWDCLRGVAALTRPSAAGQSLGCYSPLGSYATHCSTLPSPPAEQTFDLHTHTHTHIPADTGGSEPIMELMTQWKPTSMLSTICNSWVSFVSTVWVHHETPTYTIPGPSAERHIGIRMTLGWVFRKEAVRIKLFWIWKLVRVTVQFVYYHGECHASRDALVIWPTKEMFLCILSHITLIGINRLKNGF